MSEQTAKGTRSQRHSQDRNVEQAIDALAETYHLTASDLVNGFPVYARRTSLKRFLAHYELFRMTMDLPGDIVEVGVFRGQSLLSFANFLEIRNMGDRSKTVWGFDNFAGFREISPEDGPAMQSVDKVKGGWSPHKHIDELKAAIQIFDSDRFIPYKPRIELVVGDVEETIPRFIEEHPGLRISLLHLDVDVYKPTLVAMEHFFPRIVPGGVVILDEYGLVEWGGESKAVEECLAGQGYIIKKFDWVSNPGGYIIKK